MAFFWVQFSDRSPGTIEADEVHAAEKLSEQFGKFKLANTIPYPARPVLHQTSSCPPFCYEPNKCKHRTSCPNNPACTN